MRFVQSGSYKWICPRGELDLNPQETKFVTDLGGGAMSQSPPPLYTPLILTQEFRLALWTWNQQFNIKYYFCSSTIDNKHLNPKLNKHFIFNLSQSFSIITSTVKPTLKDKLWRQKNLKTDRFLSSLSASCAIYVLINGKNEGRNYQISLCLKNHFILVRINLFGTFFEKKAQIHLAPVQKFSLIH